MTKEKLAILIAEYFAAHNEIDNLGDGESINFLGELPTVNVVELAEKILDAEQPDIHGPNCGCHYCT